MIVDQVIYGTGTAADKALAAGLTVNGKPCNDGNPATVGETWLNGVCQGGVSTNGTPCNDNNAQTINDIYTNGVCAGTNIQGQTCKDGNVMTVNDIYNNGVCAGTLTVNGQTCDDGNPLTVNDIYTNGVCAGHIAAFTGTPTTLTSLNKATYTYTMLNSYWGQTGAGLFDNIVDSFTVATSNSSVYWAYGSAGDTTIQINVSEPFKIWRKAQYALTTYSGTLQILKLENGVYVDRTTLYSIPKFIYGYSGSSTTFEAFTYELPAGTYRFNAMDAQYRIDSEWFIEKKI